MKADEIMNCSPGVLNEVIRMILAQMWNRHLKRSRMIL